MAVETVAQAGNGPKPRRHRVAVPPVAKDIIEHNESGLFDIHEDAITAMEALHELELPADASPSQRQAKRDAFMAMSAVARLAAPMESMNTTYLMAKDDTDDVQAAVKAVDKAQRERSERRKGTK